MLPLTIWFGCRHQGAVLCGFLEFGNHMCLVSHADCWANVDGCCVSYLLVKELLAHIVYEMEYSFLKVFLFHMHVKAFWLYISSYDFLFSVIKHLHKHKISLPYNYCKTDIFTFLIFYRFFLCCSYAGVHCGFKNCQQIICQLLMQG